jgi:hypothetical protein
MPQEPNADEFGDMPAEFGFAHGVRGKHAIDGTGEVTTRICHADGSVEERREVLPARPDAEAVSPESISGVYNDVLYYVYNPANDVLSVRLIESFGDAVAMVENGHDLQVMTSRASGEPVGMLIRGYLRRFVGATPGSQALSPEVIEHGLPPVREQLRPAA